MNNSEEEPVYNLPGSFSPEPRAALWQDESITDPTLGRISAMGREGGRREGKGGRVRGGEKDGGGGQSRVFNYHLYLESCKQYQNQCNNEDLPRLGSVLANDVKLTITKKS